MLVKLTSEKYGQNKQFAICRLERAHFKVLCQSYEDSWILGKYFKILDPISVLKSPNKRDNNSRMLIIIAEAKWDRHMRHQRRLIL